MQTRLCCTEDKGSNLLETLVMICQITWTLPSPGVVFFQSGATRKFAYNLMFKPVKTLFTENQKYSG
jgi:hypothetical protein